VGELELRGRRLRLELTKPLVMAILNVGDDSVADPLHLRTPAERLARAHQLLEEGATLIDVGAISGRTDTPAPTVAEELSRLLAVVEPLAEEGVLVSVDTWRAETVEAVLKAGAALINDVSGLADPRVAELCADHGAGLVVMHTRAKPKHEHFPTYANVVAEVSDFLAQKAALAERLGVGPKSLLLDPGLDFAKDPHHSIELLRNLSTLRVLGLPLLLAVSRKYFIGMLTDRDPDKRLGGTLGAIAHGLAAGVEVVRVHDVGEVADFIAVYAALKGSGPVDLRGDRGDERLKWLPPKPVRSRKPRHS